MKPAQPLPDGRYRVRVFPTSAWLRRDKIAGRWHRPGDPHPLRLATLQPYDLHFFSDRLYAEILPVGADGDADR